MAFNKKKWTDRKVEHPGRRKLTPVSGETNIYDVSRAEGDVTDPGDPYNAETFDDLEERIESAFKDLLLTKQSVLDALGYTPISSDEVYGNFALGSWVSNTFGTIEWINTIADVANNTAWSLPTVQNTANEALNRAKGLIQNSNPVSDLNNYVNGVGLFNTKNCVNLPAGSYTTSEFYMVISACVNADTGIQIAYEIIGDKTSHKKVWFRTLVQKTWLPWVRE